MAKKILSVTRVLTIEDMILILGDGYHSITQIESPKVVTRVTRQGRSHTYVVTVGKPNYATREFIKRYPGEKVVANL